MGVDHVLLNGIANFKVIFLDLFVGASQDLVRALWAIVREAAILDIHTATFLCHVDAQLDYAIVSPNKIVYKKKKVKK